MFDFDELENDMPVLQARSSCAMSHADFRDFGKTFQEAIGRHDFEEATVLLSQAVWSIETLQERLPGLVRELVRQLADLQLREDSAASALMYMLWMLSLSTSLHQVCVTKGSAACALIFGFGGSGVEDLGPQVDWYRSHGFTVISTSPVSWPESLRDKQEATLAEKLHEALTNGNGQLLLHLCSNGGFLKGAGFIGSWSKGQGRFLRLPRPSDCIKAMVMECAPARPLDPITQEVLESPEMRANDAISAKVSSSAIQSEVAFYQMVIRGCIGALCLKSAVDAAPVLENDIASKSLERAAEFGVLGPPTWAYSGRSEPPWDFKDFELWDSQLEKAIPRLFLYSDRDTLVHKDKVEAYVRYTEKYNPRACVLRAVIPKAPHCRLWRKPYVENCQQAVSELLNRAGLA
eukprot:TRINITY_DN108503_c0_g1_i1.p1 TRINITY_DN108503_c0_g1~~TRINITY_DN108503_c0_g1_i1.p1  ORF type:complete len:405 (+),score=60.49 TRINITY_DN108503_c0_g1_i1:32-1246(+)